MEMYMVLIHSVMSFDSVYSSKVQMTCLWCKCNPFAVSKGLQSRVQMSHWLWLVQELDFQPSAKRMRTHKIFQMYHLLFLEGRKGKVCLILKKYIEEI